MLQLKRIYRLAAVTAALTASPWLVPSAHAVLGGAPESFSNAVSVQTVQRSIAAAASVASGASANTGTSAYSVRESTLNTGTIVREYVAPNGQVFGAAWQGPVQPSFSQLFGSANFSTYASDVAAIHAARGARAPVTVDTSNLVVHVGGHMRAFFGQAWLPQSLPAGVTGDDIR